MQNEIRTLDNHQAASLICQALDILQEHGINQKTVSEEIGFSQLSKIRSYEQNKNKSDGKIASRSMPDLLLEISQIYGFSYDQESGQLFQSTNGQLGTMSQIDQEYIFYYYNDQTAKVDAGLLTFLKHRRVKLEIIDDEGVLLRRWQGNYSKSSLFLFCDLEKKDEAGTLRGMHSYYIGNTSTWRQYYVGTHSGIKPDGSLIVGKNVLVKVASPIKSLKDIIQPIDYHIQHFLSLKNLRVKPFLPQSLAELVTNDELIDFFKGTYSFYFNGSANNLRSGILELSPNGQARFTTSTTKYFGNHTIIGGRTLQLELVQKDTQNEDFGAKVYIHFNVYRTDSKSKIYAGVGIGRNRTRMSFAFPCAIIQPEIQVMNEEYRSIISTILNGELASRRTINTVLSPSYDSIDDLLAEKLRDEG